jgi:phospholipid transport system substrate-binding protein
VPKLRSLAAPLLASLALAPVSGASAESPAAAPPAAAAPAAAVAQAPDGAEAQAASDHAAGRVVGRLHEALLGVMRDATALGYQGRYQRLSPVIHSLFDLPFMAEKSVGRHWKATSESNQRALVEIFSRFTVANFAGRFDGFSGQSFRTLEVEPSTYGTVLVRTRLDEPGDEGVALDYRLRPVGDGWRIVDIYLNGTVSELALRRSEYSALIQREGFQALLAKLDERIQDLAQAKPTQS